MPLFHPFFFSSCPKLKGCQENRLPTITLLFIVNDTDSHAGSEVAPNNLSAPGAI